MRKIILCLAVSLDGYIEGLNGETDWMVFDEETASALNDFISQIDTIFYGRLSYEKWGTYNPGENSSEGEKVFYAKTSKMKKYVFSTAASKFDGDPRIIHSNVSAEVQNIKAEPGKDIWLYGGASLITTFMNSNLVDEMRIAVIPILLGSGKPMFRDIHQRIGLQLIRTSSSKSGVVELVYRPTESRKDHGSLFDSR